MSHYGDEERENERGREAQVEMEHRRERFKCLGDEGKMGSGEEEIEHILQTPPH